ncbi:60S ribosomal protein L24 [Dirofilaria immitis]|nr:60S ribosomal protein L24 [Dirofilaria immitis]
MYELFWGSFRFSGFSGPRDREVIGCHALRNREMKLETCVYSGYKIYPGHGKRMVRADGKRSYRLKRNPRDIPWTVLYRRKHKKGVHGEENIQKKRTRRVIQIASRAVGNVSLEAILAKRNQKPEFRRAQHAARAAKSEKKAANKALKVTLQAFDEKKAAQPKMKVPKPMKAQQPRVGGKR